MLLELLSPIAAFLPAPPAGTPAQLLFAFVTVKRMLFTVTHDALSARTDDALDLPQSIGAGFAFAVQELLHNEFLLICQVKLSNAPQERHFQRYYSWIHLLA